VFGTIDQLIVEQNFVHVSFWVGELLRTFANERAIARQTVSRIEISHTDILGVRPMSMPISRPI
jgi:hypothetical protein